MLAYHGDENVKTAILSQLQKHYDADELIKGQYWEGGKGCAVGCTIHSGNHREYEPRFGIPQVLARIEDRIFEGLPNDRAKEWPLQFMAAIRPCADLAGVWPKFAAWLLVDEAHGVIRFAKTDEQRAIMRDIADAYLRGEADRAVSRGLWDRASEIRRGAAYGVGADAAAYAAYAAAYAGNQAADVGIYAAYAAAYAATAAARQKHYVAQADKMLELLRAA